MLEIAPEEARAGNSAFTGGAFRVVYHGFDDLARLIPDISEHELEQRRFRHLHRGAVFRRYGPADPVPLRPGHDRDPDPQQLRDRGVDARQGRALSARARPPGVPGRRQVQILGRARLPHLGRRQGIDEGAARARRARRDHGALRDPGDRPVARRPRRRGRAGAPSGPHPRPARQGGDPRLRRVRGQCRDAGALSRAELGPRQGARHALQHRAKG